MNVIFICMSQRTTWSQLGKSREAIQKNGSQGYSFILCSWWSFVHFFFFFFMILDSTQNPGAQEGRNSEMRKCDICPILLAIFQKKAKRWRPGSTDASKKTFHFSFEPREKSDLLCYLMGCDAECWVSTTRNPWMRAKRRIIQPGNATAQIKKKVYFPFGKKKRPLTILKKSLLRDPFSYFAS